jgi:hypothetical protein
MINLSSLFCLFELPFVAPSKPAPKGKPAPKKPVQKDNLDDLFGMLDNNGIIISICSVFVAFYYNCFSS